MSLSSHAARALGRRAPLLLVLGVAGVAAAGCGNDVPAGAVAKVDDAVIEKKDFDHWLEAAIRGQQPPEGGGEVLIPDPPDFKKCIEAAQALPVPEGVEKPSEDQLKDQCKQQYEAVRDQVMQFLISAEWIQQEAERRDIKVTDEEVKKQFEDQKAQAFPEDKDYQDFLKTSGQTEADLLFRVRVDVLSNKIRTDIVEGQGEITEDDVKKYYEDNKERFATPETRDLRIVLTETEEDAAKAKADLDSGKSFREVARERSIDEASKSQGGLLPAVARGQQEPSFEEAIFGAERGQLVGPVETQFGFYVFEVSKVNAADQQSFEEAQETIRALVQSEREQKALDDFIEDFRERWKDMTVCADDFVIEDCKNTPKASDTGPASGAPPQAPTPQPQGGAPVPQGAPPQAGGAPPPSGAPPPPSGAPPPQAAP